MSDVNLLLDRIKADPDDIVLRGAYADALDERGGDEDRVRAELIRVMCSIAVDDPDFRLDWSMNSKVYDGSADERIRRTAELVRRCLRLWSERDRGGRFYTNTPIWHRGFPEEFRGTVREWAEVGDWMCREGPVTWVTFAQWHREHVVRFDMPVERRGPHLTGDWAATWAVKGKDTKVAKVEGLIYPDYDAVYAGRNTFYEKTLVMTETVLREWWPTVRNWKGIRTD